MRGIPLLVAAAFLVLAPTAAAQAVELTITAQETGCTKTYCFEVTSGSLASVQPGSTVTLTFDNPGDNIAQHEVSVIGLAQRDPEHKDTKKSSAIATSEANIQPGNMDTVEFTVPSDATGIYFWCSVPGHEGLGMWLEQSFGGTEETNGGASPGVTPLFTLLAALGIAFVARRRNA